MTQPSAPGSLTVQVVPPGESSAQVVVVVEVGEFLFATIVVMCVTLLIVRWWQRKRE